MARMLAHVIPAPLHNSSTRGQRRPHADELYWYSGCTMRVLQRWQTIVRRGQEDVVEARLAKEVKTLSKVAIRHGDQSHSSAVVLELLQKEQASDAACAIAERDPHSRASRVRAIETGRCHNEGPAERCVNREGAVWVASKNVHAAGRQRQLECLKRLRGSGRREDRRAFLTCVQACVE